MASRKPPFVKVQGVTTLRRLNRRAILAVCFVMHCGDKDQGCKPLAWYYPLKCLVPPPGGESALVEQQAGLRGERCKPGPVALLTTFASSGR